MARKKERIRFSPAKWVLSLSILIIFTLLFSYCSNELGSFYLRPKNKTEEIANREYVKGVQKYLKQNLYNWDSYEAIEFGDLTPISDSTFVVHHKFKNKNSYGDTVQNNLLFYVDSSGNVFKIDENN